MLLLSCIPVRLMLPVSVIFSLFSVVIILWLAPIDNVNKPIDETQRKIFRKVSICVTSILIGILVILIIFNQRNWCFVISQGMLLDAVMLLTAKLNKMKVFPMGLIL